MLGLFSLQMGWVQQKTITGDVTDETGLPLTVVTIVVENTNRGVSTDFDGSFTIEASADEVLIFSYVGYTDQKVTTGAADNYAVSLSPWNELEEIVVISLGIKRKKQVLGYAVSEVDSGSIEQRAEGDVGRVLSVKASGVRITNQSSISGSGTSIDIRGFNFFFKETNTYLLLMGSLLAVKQMLKVVLPMVTMDLHDF